MPTEIDPELSMRVRALSMECRELGTAWEPGAAQALYDESDHLADRAQSSGIVDLSEALLGLTAYLSSFVDTELRPGDAQLEQLRAMADAAADALDRYRARIEIAVLGPATNELPLIQATVHYLGRNMAHLGLLRSRCELLGYMVYSSDNVRDIDKAMDAGVVLVLVISTDMLASWLTACCSSTPAATPPETRRRTSVSASSWIVTLRWVIANIALEVAISGLAASWAKRAAEHKIRQLTNFIMELW